MQGTGFRLRRGAISDAIIVAAFIAPICMLRTTGDPSVNSGYSDVTTPVAPVKIITDKKSHLKSNAASFSPPLLRGPAASDGAAMLSSAGGTDRAVKSRIPPDAPRCEFKNPDARRPVTRPAFSDAK